ncbi:CsbD family protein [Synechococcus sp. BA-132 BA5]|uniref:CsbD family protein n=1 Tax=Synechococcus sp. BA-132 BA5 TaxID=3110252 RepID=UPI002B2121F9|nr:CsbD family protein [Synechococcus sp. BA-132 BA5]MEA5416178.1 CsbD family protein [Synechococcus sp. BA-132 BA5]
MGLEKDMKATAKNIEGKAQGTIGNITGDKKDQLAGKAKQAQASAEHAVEDLKDALNDTIN